MGGKSARRLQLERSLAEEPDDPFLRYGLALQCLREGDVAEGRAGLLALITDRPDEEIAAYHQLGQSYLDEGDADRAREILRTGIAKAQQKGNWHAAAEMEGLLAQQG